MSWNSVENAPFSGYLDRSQGFTHVLIVDFPNPAALKGYHDSPVHDKAVQEFRSTFEAAIDVDFWTDA